MWLKYILAAYGLYIGLGVLATLYYRKVHAIKAVVHERKTICLTFDDGIDPLYTPRLLDTLKAHDAVATFFVLGQSIANNRPIVDRMIQEGHSIGFHSLSHKNQILQWPHQVKRDMVEGKRIFDNIGYELTYYRPPWGHMSFYGLWLCKKLKLTPIHWTLIVGDWKKDQSVEDLRYLIESQIKPGTVLCLHDGRGKNQAPARTIKVLEDLLGDLKEEGYSYETVATLYKETLG